MKFFNTILEKLDLIEANAEALKLEAQAARKMLLHFNAGAPSSRVKKLKIDPRITQLLNNHGRTKKTAK